MMTLDDFLADLQRRDVKLWIEDGRLRYRAPKGVMGPELTEELRRRKSEILSLLANVRVQSIPRLSAAACYELSHAQRRLWILSQFEGDFSAYNIPLHLLFEGELDRRALDSAFQLLIDQHESLRTTFTTVEGEPRQIIHAAINFSMEWVDWIGEPDGEARARAVGREEARKPFDLERGPLLRVVLIRLAERRHVLLFTMHHIVSDGWSIGLILRQLIQHYMTVKQGTPTPVAPLAIHYRDYAHWQNRWLESDAAASQRQYWLSRFEGEAPVLNLPTDYPRPSVQTFNGDELPFEIGVERTLRLNAFCRERNASLFMMLLALVKVLLYRYTGQEDSTIGSPVAGRTHPDLEEQIGFYLNALALRDRVSGTESFVEFLGRVKATVSEALDRQAYPFDLLVDELNLKRDLSRSPLFDTVVILQKNERETIELEGVQVKPFLEDVGISKFDLTFDFRENPEGLHLGIEYNTDLFRRERIERMGGHFMVLLDGILAESRVPIDALPLLTFSERQKILVEFNQTDVALPDGKTVVDLIERRARACADRMAVECGGVYLTYREMNDRADRLAGELIERGMGRGDFIGIYLERSVQLAVALLAVMKAGAAYVPLDPAFPSERLAFMAEDAGIRLILTQTSLCDSLTCPTAIQLNLDEIWGTLGEMEALAPVAEIAPDDLVYAIYTSGSTGTPKGVQIPHRALLNFLLSMAERPGLTANDVLLAVTTLSFDIAGLELFLPWIQGGRVVLASREETADGLQLLRKLQSCGATVMQATPATWRLLLAAGWEGTSGLKILCGGEALPCLLAERLLQCGDDVWNLYGPTETTVWSTVSQVESRTTRAGSDAVEPIGCPIANTQVYVLDRAMQPLPIGVPGELWIGGAGLARGYGNRPELTTEKFVDNPFAPAGGERLYRTGDLAAFREDGTLDYLGRIDRQVKIRGFRIEIGEIEAILSRHPSIRECVVSAKDDVDGECVLVAFIVVNETVSDTDLRRFLQAKLPDYMIPSYFSRLEAFPLTPNGKVDRKTLLESGEIRVERAVAYEAPRNATEARIAEYWRDVLGVETIGVRDNFFALGGHSLKATKLMYRLQRDMEADVHLLDIFRAPTIAELAQLITERGRSLYSSITPVDTERSISGDWERDDEIQPLTAEELELLNE